MQTTISLQEGPRGKDDAFAEEPRAQTGLRGGKLGAHYARIARPLRAFRYNPLIYMAETAINMIMQAIRHTMFRSPGITARLTAARRPI